jgi:CSLREA domain-containing protein
VLALLLGALLALAAPAWASAAEFTVNSTGDGAKAAAGAVCETATAGECTLRAAVQAANEPGAGTDTIKFDPAVFNGEATDTIAPAALPEVLTSTTIDGAACNAGSTVPCLSAANAGGGTLLTVNAGGSTIQNMSITIPAGAVGVRLNASGPAPAVTVRDNTIAMTGTTLPSTGLVTSGANNLIEGNKITSALGFNFELVLRTGGNQVLGNELLGASCCQAGITMEFGGSGNQIGGDTEASENLIEGFEPGAIRMEGAAASHNEVRRNRGANGSNFVNGSAVAAPVITEAAQASLSGTAEPGATVRVFRKATQNGGEIESFLGEAEADGVTGAWKVTFPKVPVGTFAGATQTLAGSTSGLGGSATVVEGAEEQKERQEKEAAEKAAREAREREAAETAARERQEREAQEQRDKEAAEKAGGTGGGSTGGGSSNPPSTPTQPAPSAPVRPVVKITAGPKRSSTATTARFRFTATPAAGAKFECKLDAAKWAKCKSPKTYKKLKQGRHTFRVRATANGLTGAAATVKFTVSA